MKKKKMLSWTLASAMVLGMGTNGVLAHEDDSGSSQPGACDFYSVYPGDPIPEEGKLFFWKTILRLCSLRTALKRLMSTRFIVSESRIVRVTVPELPG